jgi:hypothetical protein
MLRMIERRAGWLLLAATAFMIGCEEKLTYERWQLINQGSTQLEVESAIGEPTIKLPNQWTYQDHDRSITAHIYFDRDTDKVIAKQWIEPPKGLWEGQNPDEAGYGEKDERRDETDISIYEK